MSERWTPVYDRLFQPDHHLADEPACRRWAWVDLCHMAQYEKGIRIVGATVVELERGELLASLRYLSERWRWSVKKVRTFLDILEHPGIEKLGTVRGTPAGTVYRIVNYDTYANPGNGKGHSKSHDRGTTGAQAGHRRGTKNSSIQQVQQVSSTTRGRAPEEDPDQDVENSPPAEPDGPEKPDKRRSRSVRLPKSWKPNETHAEYADQHRLDLKAEAGKFRDHAEATGRTLKDWDAGFRMWLRKSVEFRSERGPDFGDETARDRSRANKARERAANRAAEERRHQEEVDAELEATWERWWADADDVAKRRIQADVDRRLETIRQGLPDAKRRPVLKAVVMETMRDERKEASAA